MGVVTDEAVILISIPYSKDMGILVDMTQTCIGVNIDTGIDIQINVNVLDTVLCDT